MKQKYVIGLLSLLTCGCVTAQTSGIYIGAAFLDAETEWQRETDVDSGVEAKLGYMLDDNFSLELAYVDLGTVKLPEIPDAGGKADTDGYSVSILGLYPINRFNLIGKVGYLWAETEGHLGSVAGPIEFRTDKDEFLLGIGISYDLTDNFDVRLEYNESDNFSWAGIGINLRF